jgi:hypothetical protein
MLLEGTLQESATENPARTSKRSNCGRATRRDAGYAKNHIGA